MPLANEEGLTKIPLDLTDSLEGDLNVRVEPQSITDLNALTVRDITRESVLLEQEDVLVVASQAIA